MSRMDQVNQLLHSEIASLVQQNIHLDGAMITVTYVDCGTDLKTAKIAISVLPDKFFGTALSELRKHSGLLTKKLGKLNLKNIPKLSWVIDPREKRAAAIEKALHEI